MRIIGIDPGIERTGFAVLEGDSNSPKLLDFGIIHTSKKLPFQTRLGALASDLRSLLREWKPQAAGLEQIFFSKNVKSAMKVSHARGVILETLEEHGVPVKEFIPSDIKIAVSGDGRADKKQIRKMLQYLMKIDVRSDDAADAIACGLTLIYTFHASK